MKWFRISYPAIELVQITNYSDLSFYVKRYIGSKTPVSVDFIDLFV